MAWDTFGSLNGAPSYDALRAAIARYRLDEIVGPTTNIGCRILVEPMFFPSHLWIDLPSSWSRHIQGGKSYSTDEVDGLALWNRLQDTAQSVSAGNAIGFEEAGSPTLGRVLINVQMSGFGGEAEILCSIRALPVLTLKRHAGLRIVAAQN